MLIAPLFVMVQHEKTEKSINRMHENFFWYTYAMEYNSSI